MRIWKDEWDIIKKRLDLLWSNEILDRCCIKVTAPSGSTNSWNLKTPATPEDWKKWYTDGEWILERNKAYISDTYFAGDAFPVIFPYSGTGGHAKYIAPAEMIEYHPDMEQVRHLDTLLSIDGINMIQWTQVTGQPPVTEFIPVLQRIQRAGKGLVLIVDKSQLKVLLDNLSPKGVMYITNAASPSEADDIVQYVKGKSSIC